MQVLRRMDPRTDRFPFSSFDYAAGSAEATRHLISTGARRIAFVGGLDERSSRRNGWPDISPLWPRRADAASGGGADLAHSAFRVASRLRVTTPTATRWSVSTIWWRSG
jgi:hypothetical protein